MVLVPLHKASGYTSYPSSPKYAIRASPGDYDQSPTTVDVCFEEGLLLSGLVLLLLLPLVFTAASVLPLRSSPALDAAVAVVALLPG
jgi:hypothetical protein